MGDEIDPDYTMILNRVPKCCGDGYSLQTKSNLAVYTCKHLLCMDCWTDKSELCRANDGGKFAFFLYDSPELKEAAEALRKIIPEFTTSMRSREGLQVSRLIMEIDRLIQRRLSNPDLLPPPSDQPEQLMESIPPSPPSNPKPPRSISPPPSDPNSRRYSGKKACCSLL